MARMVPVKTFLGLPEALIARSYLQAHGMITALNSYYHGSIAWHLLFALDGIQLSVLDSDLDQARELLAGDSSIAGTRQQTDAGGHAAPATLSEIVFAVAAFMTTGLPLPLWIRRKYSDVEHRGQTRGG